MRLRIDRWGGFRNVLDGTISDNDVDVVLSMALKRNESEVQEAREKK